MLRSRMKFGFVRPESVLQLTRSELAKAGLAVVNVTARGAEPAPESKSGIAVGLDGPAPQDKTPADDPRTNPLSAGKPVFNFYSLEVVQRIGYDSFTPDSGVLIAKNKDRESDSCGYNCFTWVIDAHPEDIAMLDFKRPHGEAVMRSAADYRQLNDALFHAGLNSGSQYEWEDAANRLHFYVLDVHKDDRSVLSYQVGVRSLDDAGSQARGISIAQGSPKTDGQYEKCTFAVTNSARVLPGSAKTKRAEHFGYDIFRLLAAAKDPGWSVQLQNALLALKPGTSASVDVYFSRPEHPGVSTLTLTGKSESDSSQSSSAVCTVGD
jgi:hypothetical protein